MFLFFHYTQHHIGLILTFNLIIYNNDNSTLLMIIISPSVPSLPSLSPLKPHLLVLFPEVNRDRTPWAHTVARRELLLVVRVVLSYWLVATRCYHQVAFLLVSELGEDFIVIVGE
jgi:hypothetical protein